jgi:prepilin-type N-terminal cleavage/methylation domain-containing protein
MGRAPEQQKSVGLDPQLKIAPAALRSARRRAPGFTLLEILIVVALIAVMSTLLVPSMRGLMGIAGPRGGVNTVASAIEQARLSALESGESAYVGFPEDLPGGDNPYSAVIVFRDTREDEDGDYVAVSRWMRLPQGIHVDASGLTESVSAGATFPKLGTAPAGQLRVLRFDRFGKLYSSGSEQVFGVGEKLDPEKDFTGGNYFEITVQPLTGRAIITEKTGGGGRS